MKKAILITILALGLFLRTYKLGTFPSGFLWDEAALGYNAYSILHTGKDEYGSRFPLIFKSFGDYKPGYYVYTAIPFIALFGLNEFSTRLPSALAGVLAVYLFYLLVRKKTQNDTLALICAFLLAINPWHLNFSRGSWELNLMLTEILSMIILLDKYLTGGKRRIWSAGFSVVLFVLTLLTYQSAKFITPVIFFSYMWFAISSKKQLLNKSNVTLGLTIVSVIVTFALITFAGGIGGRLKVMSLFSYPRSPEETATILNQDNQNETLYSVFHSSPVFFTRSTLGRYFNHYSGKFLFIEGDWPNPRQGVIYHGLFYLIDLIFIAAGLWVVVSKTMKPIDRFMLFWLLIAPLPSALSRDSVSSVRSFTMVIPLVYLVANGINYFVSGIWYQVSSTVRFRSTNTAVELKPSLTWFGSTKYQTTNTGIIVCYLLFVVLYLLSFIRFADLYLNHNPRLTAKDRLYGYREAVMAINEIGKSKNNIIFSTKYGQPYIFYLFYTAYSPKKYQNQAVLKENPFGDVGNVERLDNIEFRQIYWPADKGIPNTLFIGTNEELPLKDVTSEPDKFVVVADIKYPDSSTAFRVTETY